MNPFSRFSCLSFLFIFLTQSSIAQIISWSSLNSPYPNFPFRDQALLIQSTFIIAGGNGLYRSSDNGSNWQKVADSASILVNSPSGHIYAAGSKVKRSEDSGSTWSDITKNISQLEATSIAITSTGNIFVGSRGSLYRSTNAGDSWQDVGTTFVQSGDVVGALAVTATDQILAGTSNNVHRSADNGQTWTRVWQAPQGVFYSVWSILVTKSGHILICIGSNDGGIFRSTDNGSTWIPKNDGLTSKTVQCATQHPIGMIFVGTAGTTISSGIFASSNNGDSWAPQNTGLQDYDISAISVSPSGYIYAGSWWGTFYQSTQTLTQVENEAPLTPTSFYLYQNYPNPFNPKTFIEFTLSSESPVSLKVLNILGQEVFTILEDRFSTGRHRVEWNAQHFSSGIYLYRLVAGSHSETKKLILQK